MPTARTAIPADAVLERDDEIGAGGIAGALWRRRLTVAAVVGLAALLGVLYIGLSPVRYTASTSILLDPRLGRIVGVDPSAPGFVADSSAIDSQVRLLTSQTVLARVADSLHLQDDPDFTGSRFSLSRLFGSAGPSTKGADLKALENALTIKRPERTYLVEIQASASTPEKAAAIANGVADAYNDDQISARVVSARSDSKFVAQKRDDLRRQIEDAEHRIEAYKRANNIVSSDGLRSNEQQVADLTRELGTSRGRLSDLKARADQIAAVARSGNIASSNDALKSPTIERLRSSQADTERELARLSETLGPRHPARLEAEAQSQRMRELITAELGRLRQSADGEYQAEKRNEAQLVAELDRIKRQSTDTSSKLVPLRQMEREVDALRQSDERFSRISDTLTQQEADTPPARVVAAARPPVSPSWPRRSLILGLALALGLFLGVGAALAQDGTVVRRRRIVRTVAEPTARAVRSGRVWDDEPSATSQSRADLRSPTPRGEAAVDPPAAIDEDEDYYRSLRARRRPGGGKLVWS